MIYPKNPYCPLNNPCPPQSDSGNDNCDNNCNNNGGNNSGSNMNCEMMLKKISELEFAITDLNLYLDTHPNNKDALKMLTQLSATLKSMMYDYVQKCGPLVVTDVSDTTPFEWTQGKWPWQA